MNVRSPLHWCSPPVWFGVRRVCYLSRFALSVLMSAYVVMVKKAGRMPVTGKLTAASLLLRFLSWHWSPSPSPCAALSHHVKLCSLARCPPACHIILLPFLFFLYTTQSSPRSSYQAVLPSLMQKKIQTPPQPVERDATPKDTGLPTEGAGVQPLRQQ